MVAPPLPKVHVRVDMPPYGYSRFSQTQATKAGTSTTNRGH